jgi:hypothetical protein
MNNKSPSEEQNLEREERRGEERRGEERRGEERGGEESRLERRGEERRGEERNSINQLFFSNSLYFLKGRRGGRGEKRRREESWRGEGNLLHLFDPFLSKFKKECSFRTK